MKFFKFWKVFPKSPTVTVFFKEFLAQPQDCSILKSVPFLIWWLILKKRATDEYERTRRKKVHWSECLAATHGNYWLCGNHQRLSRIATQKLQLRVLSSFTILQWNYRWVLENGIFSIRFVNLLPLETVNKNIPYKKYCFPALTGLSLRAGGRGFSPAQ